MFTDLVASTERVPASLGDGRWKAVLDRHDAILRWQVGTMRRNRREEPGRRRSCGVPVSRGPECQPLERRAAADLADDDLSVRIGLHVGDVDRRGDDISGLAVHIVARAMASAAAGEIIVTQSVQVALAGQGTDFEPRGVHSLKGVPGEWALLKLADS